MNDTVRPEYEVFEQDKPSFLPSYIMSAFVLLGIVSVWKAGLPLWPLGLGHLFFAIWFGVFFVWMLRNARSGRQFSSNRLVVTDTHFKHTFRYAIAEADFVEIPISEIKEVKILREATITIEVNAEHDFDLYVLPKGADPDRIVSALLKINPGIRVQDGLP